MNRVLDCAGKSLNLDRPVVMGVINVTPDSFSDGGRFLDPAVAVRRAEQMIAEGAALIDVGGESTRPGSRPVPVQQELDRVMPVIEALASLSVPVSVDTSKPEVMGAALRAGAGMVNDVRALREPGALEVVSRSRAAICLMHMQGTPATMQKEPVYGDVIAEIGEFLDARIVACELAGIERRRIVIDPGFGFGKTLSQNLELLAELGDLRRLDAPLLVGISRKSMIGAILDLPVGERLNGSLAAAALAVWQGASIVRCHDVAATVQALRICSAVMEARPCHFSSH
jgi:dihydropteroate synthase